MLVYLTDNNLSKLDAIFMKLCMQVVYSNKKIEFEHHKFKVCGDIIKACKVALSANYA